MEKEHPISISNINGLLLILIGFMITSGILIIKLVGVDKINSNLSDSPVTFGLTLILLVGLFFVLPLMLLLMFKKILLYKSELEINYPFRQKKMVVNYADVGSIKTYEKDALGFHFTEVCIKLKNNKTFIFTTASNKDLKKCMSTLSKMIKKK